MSVRRSVMFSVLERYLSQVLVIATTAVMARILTPAESGLFLVAQSVILLAENFRDFGVGAYIVQKRQLSRDLLRTTFTITMMLSLLMGSAIYLGAGSVASFYGQPELEHLLLVATIGFLVIPFGSPVIALLKRDLAFRTLALINIVAAVVNAAVTVGAGLAGLGAASYIWGYVISAGLLTLLALAARPVKGIFLPSIRGARSIFSFGTISVVVTVANMAYELLPRLAFGKMLGFDAVGIFSRALTICQLPDRVLVSGLQPVVLPAMAAHARAGGDLKPAYLRGLMLMSAVQWPVLLMLALLAEPVVRVLLGSQWLEAVPLVRVIALANMALAPAFMTYPLLIAMDRVRDTLWATLVSLPPSALLMIAVAPHGLDAVAMSLLVIAPFQMGVTLVFIRRAIGIDGADLWRATAPSLVVALCAAALPLTIAVGTASGFAPGWAESAAMILGGAFGWVAGLRLVRHPLMEELIGVRSYLGRRFGSTQELPAPDKVPLRGARAD